MGLIVLILVLVGCPATTPKPFPPPEPYTPLATTTPPETTTEPKPELIEVPLSYEVIDSFIEEDSYSERRRMVIGEEVIQDEVVEVTYPIGCVTLQNTDSEEGEFKVTFTFYSLDKFLSETHGEDEVFIKLMGREYNQIVTLNLELGEEATAKYEVRDISIDEDEWVWEFEVIPSTKLVKE